MMLSPHIPRKLLIAVAFGVVLTLAPVNAAVRPPHLKYEMMKLPNGLTVVLSPDDSTPIVHVELWYHVGSKDEKAGRTGFAHLFEHMMFKGSKNVEPEEHASMLASIGGQSNAYTNDDATVFWQTVPSQYLPLVLWMEADRMATLRIDKSTFENEREVVKEERRLRVDNPPFGRLSEILYDQFYTLSPYKHTTIGSMKDLDAASVEDVRDFHSQFYVPHNATMALLPAASVTVATSRRTPGSRGSASAASAGLPRSAASAYWVRSLVPMLRKSTCGTNAAAFRAVAGTSTMIPTWSPAGRPRPSRSIAASSLRRASTTSSTEVTIGNITLTGVSWAVRTIAVSWSRRRSCSASAKRMPRTPRKGFASVGCGA